MGVGALESVLQVETSAGNSPGRVEVLDSSHQTMCRACGAWYVAMPCTQRLRTGLRSSAPPALRYDSQAANYKRRMANYKSLAINCELPIASRELPLADSKSTVPKPERRRRARW
jgi:hypothetical protein